MHARGFRGLGSHEAFDAAVVVTVGDDVITQHINERRHQRGTLDITHALERSFDTTHFRRAHAVRAVLENVHAR